MHQQFSKFVELLILEYIPEFKLSTAKEFSKKFPSLFLYNKEMRFALFAKNAF